jgi:DNA-binding SARP family transcriptional activator
MGIEFGILGPLEARVDGVQVHLGGPRQRAVLAILLGHANEVVPVDRLIDDVWNEDAPETAASVLQNYVSHLRRTLGRDVIATRGRDYAIRVPDGTVDLHRFERLCATAAVALGEGRPGDASADLRDALALWRGPALSDLHDSVGAGRIAARLEELRNAALERRIEADLAGGRDADAVIELAGLIGDHPLRERLRALHMLALYRCGRQAEALAAYRDARATLVEDLGIEPGRELQELERAILRQDPAIAGDRAARVLGGAPPAQPTTTTVVAAALDADAVGALVALAEPLARGPHRELVIAATVAASGDLAPLARRLADLRGRLGARGTTARAAAFTSARPGHDLLRLADEQEARLLVVDAPPGLLDDPELMSMLEGAACDVAVMYT